MNPLPNDLQRLVDDFADGCLSEESARALVKRLEHSDALREQSALAVVVERLLRSWAKGPVSTEQTMARVRAEGGTMPGGRKRPRDRRVRRRIAVHGDPRGGVTSAVERGRKERERASAVGRLRFLVLLLVAAVVIGFVTRRSRMQVATSPVGEQPKAASDSAEQNRSVVSAHVDGVEDTARERGSRPGQDYGPVSHVLQRFLPLDPPPPSVGEAVSVPLGNGEQEPGFVPPPESWVAEARMAGASSASPSDSHAAVTLTQQLPKPPVLCVKISHGSLREWCVTPRDVPSLLREMADALQIHYGTDVRSLDGIDVDPAGNPIVFFTGHYHFVLSNAQRCLLRRFVLGGGMLIFNAGLGSKPFYDSARRELGLILPELPLERLGGDHPIFHAYYDLDEVDYCEGVRQAGYTGNLPWLEGIALSCRTAAVVSRWGMAAGWEGREDDAFRAYRSADARRLGINLLSYGAAVRAWVKRTSHLATFFEGETPSAGALFVAQIVHDGEWQTRYAGLPLLLHTFNRRTEVPVKLSVKPMRLTDPDLFNVPLLYVTGHETLALGAVERDVLKRYLVHGGFLFAEACCGRAGFDRDFRALIARVFPETPLTVIPAGASVFRVPNAIELLGVTPALAAKRRSMLIPPRLEGIQLDGHLAVIYSPYGLAGGWEMSQTPFADGYEDPDALKLGQNILMHAITQ